jgi:hypothetical protein
MSCPSFSGSFDLVTRLVAHVPVKFIVGALAASERPWDRVPLPWLGCHRDGIGRHLGGLLKDEREAVRLFKLSADQGNSRGQLNLGFAMSERSEGYRKTSVKPSGYTSWPQTREMLPRRAYWLVLMEPRPHQNDARLAMKLGRAYEAAKDFGAALDRGFR